MTNSQVSHVNTRMLEQQHTSGRFPWYILQHLGLPSKLRVTAHDGIPPLSTGFSRMKRCIKFSLLNGRCSLRETGLATGSTGARHFTCRRRLACIKTIPNARAGHTSQRTRRPRSWSEFVQHEIWNVPCVLDARNNEWMRLEVGFHVGRLLQVSLCPRSFTSLTTLTNGGT